MKSRQVKARCNLCSHEVFDSINPEKIITCARCVQILLMASQQNKVEFRNLLLSKGLLEAARSVESFIVPEDDTDVATFETSFRKRGSNHLVHRVKRGLNRQPTANHRS